MKMYCDYCVTEIEVGDTYFELDGIICRECMYDRKKVLKKGGVKK